MNKYAIPTILVATVLVAGIFEFMPIQQASTVHTTLQNSQTVLDFLELTDTTIVAADVYTLNCNGEMVVVGIDAVAIGTILTDEEFGAVAIGGENHVEAQADGALAGGSNEVLTNGPVGGPADEDLTFGPTAGTYTGDTLVMKASVLHASSTTCTFTETT